MRKLITTALLTLTLAIPVCAGEMGNPIAPPPNGREAQTISESAKTGDIGCPRAGAEITMTLLQTLLALI